MGRRGRSENEREGRGEIRENLRETPASGVQNDTVDQRQLL